MRMNTVKVNSIDNYYLDYQCLVVNLTLMCIFEYRFILYIFWTDHIFIKKKNNLINNYEASVI